MNRLRHHAAVNRSQSEGIPQADIQRPHGWARRRALARVLVVAATLTGACAPGEPAKTTVALHVTAQTTLGDPLPKVRAWLDGKALGSTGRDGTLRGKRRVSPGSTLGLSLACPPGYATDQAERRIPVRRTEGTPPTLRVSVACKAETPMAALVVRTAPQIPIVIDGERVGLTDDEGIGHVLLRTEPGTAIQVALDTSAHPRLRPRNPVRTFDIGDDDQLLLVDQPLMRKSRHRRIRRQPPAAPQLPPPARPTEIH